MQRGQDRNRLRLSLIVATLVVAVDQLSKLWIRDNLTPGESLPEIGFLRLTYTTNTGSAFGLFANQTFLLVIITIVSLAGIVLFLRYLGSASAWTSVALGLILGGAVGNLIDRLHLGYVVDFIDVRLWGNLHWPAFNVADAAIVVGICTLAYSLYRSGLFKKVYEHERGIES
jgi:signal peptidase II